MKSVKLYRQFRRCGSWRSEPAPNGYATFKRPWNNSPKCFLFYWNGSNALKTGRFINNLPEMFLYSDVWILETQPRWILEGLLIPWGEE